MKKIMSKLALGTVGVAMGATLAVADPYAPYRGDTLVVNFPAHPHYDAAMKILPQFTKETGINVEVDRLSYMKMRQKQTLELTKPKGEYDLISYVVFSKADYVYADQLENLAKYFMNPKLADPTYDPEDFVPGYMANIGIAGGKKGYMAGPTGSTYGIPYGPETSFMGYRKDILDKHGLKVPETYDELVETGCKIKQLEPGMGGVASRAASGHHASHAFLLHLAPQGGKIFDDEWNTIVNNDAGVKAAQILKDLIACGPEGSETFGFAEAGAAFVQGDAAIYLDGNAFASTAENPQKSKVAGKVGWALHPMGVRRASMTGAFGVGIPKNAQNKEAAFLLLQWLTSKKGDLAVSMAGGNPARQSTVDNPQLQAKYGYMAALSEQLQYADEDWRPIIPAWGKINAELGTALSKMITEDLDPKETLDGVAVRIDAIMKDAGYDTWK